MFAILVVMSLVTTLATTPILQLIRSDEVAEEESEPWSQLHKPLDLRRRSLRGDPG